MTILDRGSGGAREAQTPLKRRLSDMGERGYVQVLTFR